MTKMNVFLGFAIISILTACGSRTNRLDLAPTLPNLQCVAVPPGAVITTYSCPGSSGSWTRYTVTYSNSSGTSSGDAYCGGDGSGIPSNQANFNLIALSDPHMTSNNDYVQKSNCTTGSVRELTPSGEVTYYLIWNKQP
jgi:hypothetical protein